MISTSEASSNPRDIVVSVEECQSRYNEVERDPKERGSKSDDAPTFANCGESVSAVVYYSMIVAGLVGFDDEEKYVQEYFGGKLVTWD